MTDLICLPRIHLSIILLVFIGLAVWYIYNEKKKHLNDPNYKYNDNMIETINKQINELKNQIELAQKEKSENNVKYIQMDDIERKLFLNKRDVNALYNDLAPPERRQPEHAYPYQYVKNQINIPTRGLPDNYHLIGILLRNNTETAYNLFGRQTYPGSNQWEYYVQGYMQNTPIKIPIKIRGDREIEDGQTVNVPGSDPSKGSFTVKLYNYDAPRYNPYIY